MHTVILLALAAVSVLSGMGVVFSKNAVYSALCLTLNLLVMAVLYLTMSLQFLGIAQLLIYAGAIMVVFLFAVTVLAPEEEMSLSLTEGTRLSGVLVGIVIGCCLLAAVVTGMAGHQTAMPPNTAEQFATQLFGRFVLPFEGTAVLAPSEFDRAHEEITRIVEAGVPAMA